MIQLNSHNTVQNVIIQGIRHTTLGNYIFMGRDINAVLMKTVVRALETKNYLELYEAYTENGRVQLVNGENTKPFKSAIVLNNNGVVCIAEGYLSSNYKEIDWNMVGALGVNGQVVWTHPKLSINLRVVKARSNPTVRGLKADNTGKPYKNVTEFKNWLDVGKQLKVVDWKGVRNRKGIVLKVTEVVKTKGFYIDAYFGNRKIGTDFIAFQPSTWYEFKSGGLLSVTNPASHELVYVLEPVSN